jgi:riboflavin synthase
MSCKYTLKIENLKSYRKNYEIRGLMFTGIIESVGQVRDIQTRGTNKTFWIESALSGELKVDQSVSHDGACLTVEEVKDSLHRVTAIEETLQKTSLGNWKPGGLVNLERSLIMNGRLDGHIVQGHVDATAVCLDRKDLDGSWEFQFGFPAEFSHLVIEKGSVCLNGISLTAFSLQDDSFKVAIIPYSFEHTNIREVFPGDPVNIEFDILGKYLSRIIRAK